MSMHHARTVLASSMSQQVRNKVIQALFLTQCGYRCPILEISETCLYMFPFLFRVKMKAMYLLTELLLRNLVTDPLLWDILWQLVLEILMAPFNHVVEKNADWMVIMFGLPVLVWWLTTIAARIAACF